MIDTIFWTQMKKETKLNGIIMTQSKYATAVVYSRD